MVQAVSYNTSFDLVPAFAGMLADAGFTDKISVPCGALPQAFGTAVYADPTTGRTVAPNAAGAVFQGIAIHDHNISGRYLPGSTNAGDTYIQYDSIAVLRRGRIWARVATTIVKDSTPVSVENATMLLGSTTVGAGFTAAPPNMRFLSANISIIGVIASDPAVSIAMLELHDPSI